MNEKKVISIHRSIFFSDIKNNQFDINITDEEISDFESKQKMPLQIAQLLIYDIYEPQTKIIQKNQKDILIITTKFLEEISHMNTKEEFTNIFSNRSLLDKKFIFIIDVNKENEYSLVSIENIKNALVNSNKKKEEGKSIIKIFSCNIPDIEEFLTKILWYIEKFYYAHYHYMKVRPDEKVFVNENVKELFESSSTNLLCEIEEKKKERISFFSGMAVINILKEGMNSKSIEGLLKIKFGNEIDKSDIEYFEGRLFEEFHQKLIDYKTKSQNKSEVKEEKKTLLKSSNHKSSISATLDNDLIQKFGINLDSMSLKVLSKLNSFEGIDNDYSIYKPFQPRKSGYKRRKPKISSEITFERAETEPSFPLSEKKIYKGFEKDNIEEETINFDKEIDLQQNKIKNTESSFEKYINEEEKEKDKLEEEKVSFENNDPKNTQQKENEKEKKESCNESQKNELSEAKEFIKSEIPEISNIGKELEGEKISSIDINVGNENNENSISEICHQEDLKNISFNGSKNHNINKTLKIEANAFNETNILNAITERSMPHNIEKFTKQRVSRGHPRIQKTSVMTLPKEESERGSTKKRLQTQQDNSSTLEEMIQNLENKSNANKKEEFNEETCKNCECIIM